MSGDDTSLGEAVLVLSTDNNGFRMGIDDAQLAANAMQANLDRMQDHIKDRFAEKFEHVGVHLFGHDLLGAMGITQGARPILGALQMGVNALADSFGMASGPIGLVVMGLTAAAAIGYKVYESHEKHAESLEKLKKEQVEAFKTTHELGEQLEAYNALLSGATPELDNLADATKRLDDVQRHNLTTTEGETMAAAQKAMAANIERRAGVEAYIQDLERQQSQMSKTSFEFAQMGNAIERVKGQLSKMMEDSDKQGQIYEKAKADIKAQAEGFLNLEDKMKKVTQASEDLEKATKKDEDAFESFNKKIEAQLKLEDEVGKKWEETQKRSEDAIKHMTKATRDMEEDGAEASGTAYQKKAAEIRKYAVDKQFEIDKLHEVALANAQTDAQRLAADRAYANASSALMATVVQKNKENFGAIATGAIGLGKTMTDSFAGTAAKSIASAKSMHDGWISLEAQMKEQAVATALKMSIEYVAQAAKGVFMHQTVAAAAVAASGTQVAANAAVIASNHAKTASVIELTAALNAATVAAVALDVALAAAV